MRIGIIWINVLFWITSFSTSRLVIIFPFIFLNLLSRWKTEQLEYCMTLGSVWEGLRDRQFDGNYIFITATGKQMNLDTPYSKFKTIIKLHNESCENEDDKLPEIRLHDLRHTHATIFCYFFAFLLLISLIFYGVLTVFLVLMV